MNKKQRMDFVETEEQPKRRRQQPAPEAPSPPRALEPAGPFFPAGETQFAWIKRQLTNIEAGAISGLDLNTRFSIRAEGDAEHGNPGGRKLVFHDEIYGGGTDRLELLYNGELRVRLRHTVHPDNGISHALQLFRDTDGEPEVGFGTGIQFFAQNTGGLGQTTYMGGVRSAWTDPTQGSEDSYTELLNVIGGVAKEGLRLAGDGSINFLSSVRTIHAVAPPATAAYGLFQLGSGGVAGGSVPNFQGSASGTFLGVNAAAGFAGNLIDLQVAGATKLVLSGAGTLAVGGDVKISGAISGNGAAPRIKSNTITPGTDADVTVSGTAMEAEYQRLDTGAWTGAHDVILPSTTDAKYIVRNNTAFSVIFRTAGGTGVTVGAGKHAIIFTGGVNYLRLTTDV